MFSFRTRRFMDAFAASGGRPVPVERLGAETHAYEYDLGSQEGLLVTWRSGRVLSVCGGVNGERPDLADVLVLARAQERRVADFAR